MGRGILDAICYYVAGGLLATFVGTSYGWAAGHYFGPGYFVALLVIVGGLIWSLVTITLVIFMCTRTERVKGHLWCHVFVWLALGIYVSSLR